MNEISYLEGALAFGALAIVSVHVARVGVMYGDVPIFALGSTGAAYSLVRGAQCAWNWIRSIDWRTP